MLLNDSISLSVDFFIRVGRLADPFGKDILAWLAICEKEGTDQVSFSRRPATAKAAACISHLVSRFLSDRLDLHLGQISRFLSGVHDLALRQIHCYLPVSAISYSRRYG